MTELDKAMEIYNKGHYEVALNIFTRLARWWDIDAQYMLGYMCKEALGVPRDYLFSYMWYNLAASRGHKNAKKEMDKLEEKMTKTNIIKAQEYTQKWLKNNPKPKVHKAPIENRKFPKCVPQK